LFSSPDIFDDSCSNDIKSWGTIQKGMQQDFGKKLKLKWGDIKTRVKGNLTSIVWKDKRDVNKLMNMPHPPAEGNFCDEHGNALKPATVQDYNRHTGYVDSSDCLTVILLGGQTWKWTKKNCFTSQT
jgi:hypothetical protein